MIKKISYILYLILYGIDKVFKLITKKSFLIWFNDFHSKNSYKKIIIFGNEISFFIPNPVTEWRVDTFFSKEPETIEWIDSFEKKENLIFWDIGANIGLYSIYNSIKNNNSTTISFEPSSSNLRILSRNISINNLENRIKILPLPISHQDKTFQTMNEGDFLEGGALNTFGEKYNYEGKEFDVKMKYSVLGTSINYLLDNEILDIPDYIKIDVDGIEHLILKGGNKYLMNKKIKSFSIEINENFKDQYESVLRIMKENGLTIQHKKRNDEMFSKSKKFNKIYNYVFKR